MALPEPARLAHHEAGHAVVQHWVARGRFRVTRVSLESDGINLAGSSLIEPEVNLGLYEFGLVVLAGIAAENRYFKVVSPATDEPWGAIGDIDEWLAQARSALRSYARVEIVTKNVMRRLKDFFEDQTSWSVVTELAEVLLKEGVVEGRQLRSLLERQIVIF